MQHLTIAYLSNRKNPRIEWFFDSLHRETGGNYEGIKVVVIDFYNVSFVERPQYDHYASRIIAGGGGIIVREPKPSVWQGPYRLTTRDYFAAANARNTAVCYAPDGWIAFVDDLSVLMPGWLAAVRRGMEENYIVLGAYKKMKGLCVVDGGVVGCVDFPPGVDTRWIHGRDDAAVPAAGSWLYGCSFACPVEAMLKINGSDEDCDTMGGEDYIAGMMMERAGYIFKYDRRMLTYESEEAHGEDAPFLRIIKPKKESSAKDSSHWMLQQVMTGGRHTAPNYFGPEGIRGLRQRILAGESFPVPQCPDKHWPDGQLLSEM